MNVDVSLKRTFAFNVLFDLSGFELCFIVLPLKLFDERFFAFFIKSWNGQCLCLRNASCKIC
jgi:hypothetical protein